MPHQQGVQACISCNCFSPASIAPTQFLPQAASSTAPQHLVLIKLPFPKANTNKNASVFMSAFIFLLTIYGVSDFVTSPSVPHMHTHLWQALSCCVHHTPEKHISTQKILLIFMHSFCTSLHSFSY